MRAQISRGMLVLAVATALGAGAGAAERQVPQSVGEVRLSYAPIVKRVAPAVVNVYASRVVQQSRRRSSPIRSSAGSSAATWARPSQRVQRSLGSGVIVDPSGIIVTNNHVIANADRDQGGARRPARVRLRRRPQGRAHRPCGAQDRGRDRAVPDPRLRRFRRAPGRRPGACHRRPVRRRPDRDQRHRLGAGAHRRSASPTTSSSSRPTPPSIRATPAAR